MVPLKTGLLLFIAVGIASFASIDQDFAPVRQGKAVKDSVLTGKQLASRYCGSCHLVPEPELLDKKTWTGRVLPVMAMRLGLKLPGQDTLQALSPEEENAIRPLHIYPETPVLSMSDWGKIVSYYEQTAPEEPLPQKPHPSITNTLPLFTVKALSIGDKSVPQTTLLKYDNRKGQLYVGDAQNSLYVLDKNLQLVNTWWIDTPPTDIDFPENAAPRLLTIGVFSPSDQHLGRLMTLERSAKPGTSPINIKGLPRPVQFTASDLNGDGRQDALVCGFGKTVLVRWVRPYQRTCSEGITGCPKRTDCRFQPR